MSALTIPPLLRILSIPELATLIFHHLFSAGPHMVFFPPTRASRSAQLLRVSKLTHALAAPALYAMTEFDCMYDYAGAWECEHTSLPAQQYRQYIRYLKMEDPGIPALRLGEYTGLRRLTLVVPWLFRTGQAEADVMNKILQSPLVRRLSNIVVRNVALEVMIEGELSDLAPEQYYTMRRRMVFKKSGKVEIVDASGASLLGM